MQKIKHFFEPQTIVNGNNRFYQVVVLGWESSLFMLPWLFVNGLLKIAVPTFPIFCLVAAVCVFPTIGTYFHFLANKEESYAIKNYWKIWKQNFSKNAVLGIVGLAIVSILLFEMRVILLEKNLQILAPIFTIAIIIVSGGMSHLLFRSTMKKYKRKQAIKEAFFMGTRSIGKSFLIFALILLWLSIGYLIPLLNVLLGNGIVFALLFSISKRTYAITFDAKHYQGFLFKRRIVNEKEK